MTHKNMTKICKTITWMWRNQLTVYLRCSSLTLGQDTIKGKIQNSQGTNEKLKSGWEMSRILLQDEQDRSPELSLRISREGKSEVYRCPLKSNYSSLLEKHPASFHLGNFRFTAYFCVTFPSWSPYQLLNALPALLHKGTSEPWA